jgi:hypothetical protein
MNLVYVYIIYYNLYIIFTQVSVCGGVNEYTHLSAMMVGMIGCIIYLVLQWIIPRLKGIKIKYLLLLQYCNITQYTIPYNIC